MLIEFEIFERYKRDGWSSNLEKREARSEEKKLIGKKKSEKEVRQGQKEK